MKTIKLMGIITVILIFSAILPLTAFAQSGGDGEETEDLSDILIPIPIITTPEPAPEPVPLTPQGNLSLVDDVNTDTIEDK